MTETNGHKIPVALYARVSSGPQERSLDAQFHDLRELAGRAGLKVVEEVPDLAQKRHVLDRPGLDRLRELAASGAISEVWAVEFERFGEGNVPTLLAIELGAHGVRCRWPGDGGEGLGGEIMRAVAGVLSREEQRKRAERSRRGKLSKARRGQVLGASPRPRYGFSYVYGERGKPVGYEVAEDEMRVVRRIFGMLADGHSIHAVQTALEGDGVEAPRGGRLWSRDTIKNVVREDTYLPHSPGELAALVGEGLMGEEVFAALDPAAGPFGIAYYGRTRSSYASPRSKKRKVEPAPRSEWVAIPIPLRGLGPVRAEVERSRAAIADNRVPSKVGDYEYELSRGFLFCAHCGRAMVSYARRFPEKGRSHFYYRCDAPRKTRGTAPPCPNRRSHRAEQAEYEAAKLFEEYASRETLLELYERAIEEQEEETGARAALERRAALTERSNELEAERRGYLKQNARGLISDAELDAMLAEVDEQREAIAAELRALDERAQTAERLRAARDSLSGSLAASYHPVHSAWQEDPDAITPGEYLTLGATPEEIRRAYRRYGARFEVDKEGELTLRLTLGLDGEAWHLENSS